MLLAHPLQLLIDICGTHRIHVSLAEALFESLPSLLIVRAPETGLDTKHKASLHSSLLILDTYYNRVVLIK